MQPSLSATCALICRGCEIGEMLVVRALHHLHHYDMIGIVVDPARSHYLFALCVGTVP